MSLEPKLLATHALSNDLGMRPVATLVQAEKAHRKLTVQLVVDADYRATLNPSRTVP